MESINKNPEFAQCWSQSSIVYYYLIGFEGRGISNVDASHACGGIWFLMGCRPGGVKSYPRDKVYSQNFLEALISLGRCGSLVIGLFFLKKMEQE